jgi:hypothetical protein
MFRSLTKKNVLSSSTGVFFFSSQVRQEKRATVSVRRQDKRESMIVKRRRIEAVTAVLDDEVEEGK